MKKLFSVFFLLLGLVVGTSAQDCLGIKIKPGTGYEMLVYNAKDKPTGRIVYKFKDVRKEGGATVVDVLMQSFDDKGKAGQEVPLRYTCTGNELVADLSGMAQSGQNPAMKDMEMRIKANELAYPRNLSEGITLKDGMMQAELYNGATKMMDMDLAMINRKVEGKESLSTPAGTFTVYKVSSDLNMNNRAMGIPIKATIKTVNYRASDLLFDVKSETYNKSGKLMNYTLLSKVL